MKGMLCIGALVAALGAGYLYSRKAEMPETREKQEHVARFDFDKASAKYIQQGLERMKKVGVNYQQWQMYMIMHDADENDDLYINAGEAKDLYEKVLNPASPIGRLARNPVSLEPKQFNSIQKEVGEKWTRTIFNTQYETPPLLMLTEREIEQERYQSLAVSSQQH